MKKSVVFYLASIFSTTILFFGLIILWKFIRLGFPILDQGFVLVMIMAVFLMPIIALINIPYLFLSKLNNNIPLLFLPFLLLIVFALLGLVFNLLDGVSLVLIPIGLFNTVLAYVVSYRMYKTNKYE